MKVSHIVTELWSVQECLEKINQRGVTRKLNQNSAESGVAPARKLTKIDATIICNPHAHPHIMKKTYTKFQKCKRSCTHNKHPLSIYSGLNMTKFTMSKK